MQISLEGKIGIWLALVGLAGAGAIMIAPEKLWIGWGLISLAALGSTALGFHHFGRRFAFIFVAVGGLWFDYWYYSSVLNAPAVASSAEPPKRTPVPEPPPEPPPPPAPWVSEEEFQAARKVGRLLIPFTPEEISSANYSRGSVATDAYVGRWVKINHPFASVRPLTEKDKKEYLIMTVTQSGWQAVWPAYLIFDSKKWVEQILILKRGTMVRAM